MRRLIWATLLVVLLWTTQAHALRIGEAAPDFILNSTMGEIALSKALQQGPVVLALYPNNFTPRCTTELLAFQKDLHRFKELNGQVVGVNADTLANHRAFAAKLKLEFPLLVDDGTIRKEYGKGRITYLIDQSGIIRFLYKGMPINEQFLRELAYWQEQKS